MRTRNIVLLLAPVALATTPRARSGLPKSLAQSNLLNSFATCETGYVTCENACMPSDGVCCNDNTDEYCLEGYYCIPNACCPEGEICSGSSDDDADCAIGETECGDLCMPIDGTCCSDELHYCPDFGTCTDDGYCCDLGEDCSGISFSDFSSATQFTSTTSRTTTKTTTSTVDTTSTTSSSRTTSTTSTSSTSSTTSSSTTDDSNNDAPITSAPVVTTTVSQQAGGVFTADGRVAAGLAVVAALLV